VNESTIAKPLDPVKLWCPGKKICILAVSFLVYIDPSCEILSEDLGLLLGAADGFPSSLSEISSPFESP
jgi:hypothetical protein